MATTSHEQVPPAQPQLLTRIARIRARERVGPGVDVGRRRVLDAEDDLTAGERSAREREPREERDGGPPHRIGQKSMRSAAPIWFGDTAGANTTLGRSLWRRDAVRMVSDECFDET